MKNLFNTRLVNAMEMLEFNEGGIQSIDDARTFALIATIPYALMENKNSCGEAVVIRDLKNDDVMAQVIECTESLWSIIEDYIKNDEGLMLEMFYKINNVLGNLGYNKFFTATSVMLEIDAIKNTLDF